MERKINKKQLEKKLPKTIQELPANPKHFTAMDSTVARSTVPKSSRQVC